MDRIYQEIASRCEALVHQIVELAVQYKKLDQTKKQIEAEFQAARRYLQTGFDDPAVKRAYQRISELKKELSSPSKRAQKVVEGKSHVVIRLLQEHSETGLDADEIMSLMSSNGTEIDRSYLTTILGKLRKKGMVVKEGKKFFITTPGQNPITPLRLVKSAQSAATASSH
jgi:predicted transcriptional regulator of viral defense system